jgi:cellulose synthase/poly-beta-1,6-N-acetylglucosamine synthase-like glycosyltransferase
MSAYETLSRGQRVFFLVFVLLLLVALGSRPLITLLAINAILTTLYVLALLYKFNLTRRGLRGTQTITVSDDEAAAIRDPELPVYTVLVPAYQEQAVIPRTIRALEALDYPVERLDVKLLLEEDDGDSIAAAFEACPAPHIEVLVVPTAVPQTKPKACNYGLQFAHGDLVTIYDAEDRPEPLQLRRAVVAFRRIESNVACLQAKLAYHNSEQNLITRWFAVEYATWFALTLPALAEQGGPVPLGGTSMHIKRHALEEVGAWDPHNVTEDADLGVRLQRYGYRTQALDSVTYEEANSDFLNWVKQRSRWYKGYVQTALVHLRHPVRLLRQLGPKEFVAFNLTVAATPIVALVNPLFWLLTALWFLGRPPLLETLYPGWLYFPALFCLVVGNFLIFYVNLIVVRLIGSPTLLGAVMLTPLYWLMMSIAAVKAFVQLAVHPWFWEKTVHGLDRDKSAVRVVRA